MVLPAAYPSEVRQTPYILCSPDLFFPVLLYLPTYQQTHLSSLLLDFLLPLHFPLSLHLPSFLILLLTHLSAHFPYSLVSPLMYLVAHFLELLVSLLTYLIVYSPVFPAAHFPEALILLHHSLSSHPSEILIFLLILLFARFLKLLIFPLRSLFVHLPDFQMYLLLLVPPHPSFLHQSLSLPVQHDPLNHHLYVYDLLPGPLLKNSGIILMLPATTPLIFSSCAFPSLSSGLIVKHI